MTGCDSLVAADDDFVVHDRINLHQQVFGNAKYRPKIFIGLSRTRLPTTNPPRTRAVQNSLRINPGGTASPYKLSRSARSIGVTFLMRLVLVDAIPHFSNLLAI